MADTGRSGVSQGVGAGPAAVPHAAPAETNPYRSSVAGWGGGPAPIMDRRMLNYSVGSSGLRQFAGWVREEFLYQLQGRQAARVYREMQDNSPVVGSILFAIMQSMRKVEWRIQEADESAEALEAREFVESLMDDMSEPWDVFVSEALTMLTFGFAPHEIVYKKRMGPQKEGGPIPSSNYDDGKIGIKNLPIRGQDTVLKWFFDSDGRVLGLTQQPYIGPLVDIPIEKMLIFKPSHWKSNPEGRSVLRNSYVSYWYIKRLQEMEAITFERMSGVPVVYVPNSLLEGAAANDPTATATLESYKTLVTNVKVDEQMGLILPSDTYAGANGPSSVRMYEFAFITPSGGEHSQAGFNAVIERHKLDILYTVLADFIQMGHSSRGTQSLAISKVDMFFQAIEGWLNSIADALNRHLLTRLWNLNGFDPKTKPEFVPDLAQRIDLDSLGNFFLHLAQSGMPLFPDDDLENWVRDAAGLPDKGEEAFYATDEIAPDGDEESNNGKAPPGAAADDARAQPVAQAGANDDLTAKRRDILKLFGISTPVQRRAIMKRMAKLRSNAAPL